MHEKLKEFLDKKNFDEKEQLEKAKQKLLDDLGLYDKVYSPNNVYSNEYGVSEWDAETGVWKYYKKVAISITDDEYDKLKKYGSEYLPQNDNVVAGALKAIGVIEYILGFVAFIFIIPENEWMAILILVSSIISGTMFLGFSEIIKLLHRINNK